MQAAALLSVTESRAGDPVLLAQALWALSALLAQPTTCEQLVTQHEVSPAHFECHGCMNHWPLLYRCLLACGD